MPRVECAPTCRIINRNYTVYLDESITCIACHPPIRLRLSGPGTGRCTQHSASAGSVESIACVAQAGQDIAVIVQLVIDRRRPNAHVGMTFLHIRNTGPRCE
jgi:hypothetical protein